MSPGAGSTRRVVVESAVIRYICPAYFLVLWSELKQVTNLTVKCACVCVPAVLCVRYHMI